MRRHQLAVLAAAGYHTVAPDVQGYGDTDASAADEGYAPSNMAAVLVGHDWSANIA